MSNGTNSSNSESLSLVAAGAQSTQLSADGTKLYVSMVSGEIRIYDLATQALEQTIDVTAELGHMSVNNSGNTAYVVGRATANGDRMVFEVDLASGSVTELPGTAGLNVYDVEYVAGDRLLFSADQSWVYDLATQQATPPNGPTNPGFFDFSVMHESDGLVLIAQTSTSNGPLQLYDETTGTLIGAGDSYQGGSPSGFNQGIHAVSREAGLVAQFIYPEHVEIYDLNLNLVTTLRYFRDGSNGLAFSADGEFLLAISGTRLSVYDTENWLVQGVYDLASSSGGGLDSTTGFDGDEILVTPDNMQIVITNQNTGSIQILALSEPIGSNPNLVGSNGNDTLSAVLGQNVDGRDGFDRLSVDFRDATEGVNADFRGLETADSVTIEGATIANIEHIARIDGSEFDDVLAIYQQTAIGDAIINGYGGDDEIYISMSVGSFGAQVYGGDGDDLIDARHYGRGGDYQGENGNDTIYTDFSSRAIARGGDGNDLLHSWGNAEGGEGNDTIFLHDAGDVSGGASRANGGNGDDIISVEIEPGTSPNQEFQLAGGEGADTLTGTEERDFLTSFNFTGNLHSVEDTGTEQDTLIGLGGNDALFAGYGDNVDGGDGSDGLSLSLAGASAGMTINTDIFANGAAVEIGGGTIQNVEALINFYGTNFDDVLTVGASGNFSGGTAQLRGNGGNDRFIVGDARLLIYGDEGDDVYIVQDGSRFNNFYGGEGSDTVDYSGYSNGVTVALSDSPFFSEDGSGTATGEAEGQLYEVENVVGTNSEDQIVGSFQNNVIRGNDGNDIIDGGMGDDILDGGEGIDELQFLHGSNGVIVDLGITTSQNTGLGNDTINGFENLTGSNFNDHLIGDGLDNEIRGGAGNDILNGAGGNDRLIGGSGNDTFYIDSMSDQTVEEVDGGSDTVVTSFSAALAAFTNIENLSLLADAGDLNATGDNGANVLTGNNGQNRLTGGLGNDTIDGGSNVDTAVVSGNRADYTVTQIVTGLFEVVGADGRDTLINVEYLQFDDQTLHLRIGEGISVNFETADPSVYQAAMNNIRDFDGNALGGDGSWLRIGSADINGDGDIDQILVNSAIGRFATVGTAPDGLVYFDDHGWAGETRVAGIYIDPLVAAGQIEQGSDNDSQRRFQNDLEIENINRVLGADDYDSDGVQEVFFALTDGTAYLRALMHDDGNIRYANYQSEQQVRDYLTSNGYDEDTFGDWFGDAQTQSSDTLTFTQPSDKQVNDKLEGPQIMPALVSSSAYDSELEQWLDSRLNDFSWGHYQQVGLDFFV